MPRKAVCPGLVVLMKEDAAGQPNPAVQDQFPKVFLQEWQASGPIMKVSSYLLRLARKQKWTLTVQGGVLR